MGIEWITLPLKYIAAIF